MKQVRSRRCLALKRLGGTGAALLGAGLILTGAGALAQTTKHPITVTVVDETGAPISTGFRFLIEEDRMSHPVPGQRDNNALAVSFHASYMPPVAAGASGNLALLSDASTTPLEAGKHYFISILPDRPGAQGGKEYTLGGAIITPNQKEVVVRVTSAPLPTAQISVQVFLDDQLINNQHDQPQEQGLPGISIIIEDAGGRYGQVGGQVSTDVFGNPLGTSYRKQTDGRPALDDDGAPIVETMGTGEILTDANGRVTIKNLAPGKYGVKAIPKSGEGWIQTTTIEGSKVIDAWVKANEPTYFAEFGPPGPHVEFGFVKEFNSLPSGVGTAVRGKVVNLHTSRPPNYAFYNGGPTEWTSCYVGLNDTAAGVGKGVFVKKCNADGSFEIPNVPPGSYQLAIWDENLDYIFATNGFTVDEGLACSTPTRSCDFGEVPVFSWFARMETRVFYDQNRNGFPDAGEPGIENIPVNLRFRDGTIYQSAPTDKMGESPFNEVFPFFNWLTVDVDTAKLKATGLTAVVDAGGPVEADQGWTWPSRDQLTPQPQTDTRGRPVVNPITGNSLSRTETKTTPDRGAPTTQAFQAFLGTTNVVEFGKTAFGANEVGAVTGFVSYAVMRGEDDPRFAATDPYEPGIPRVPVILYKEPAPGQTLKLADIPAWNSNWHRGGAKTAADVDRNPQATAFQWGDAVAITWTDGWDDSQPTNCQGEKFIINGVGKDCFDGLRNYNQVRNGTYDGRYVISKDRYGRALTAGNFIVEVAAPKTGAAPSPYKIIKEEDKSAVFGTSHVPQPDPDALPPECVGDPHVVPAELTLFPGEPAPFAGQTRPLCDRKRLRLNAGQNATADFQFFTDVPIAGHFVGMILNDLANEFDPNSPAFGEKQAPAWVPISVRDWTGQELYRVYSDEWGTFNGLLPSTFTNNVAGPTGLSPNMLTLCMNDPGPIKDPSDPTGQRTLIDPRFDKQYSQFCYTFQYMPGTTTYLDTPVLPVSAFTGPDQFALDCEFPDGTPKVYSVSGSSGLGPVLRRTPGAVRTLTIVSEGATQVLNPAYAGNEGSAPRLITRDYGFGTTPGTVKIGDTPVVVTSWSPQLISVQVPEGVQTGELVVARGDNGRSTINTVTVSIVDADTRVVPVQPSTVPGATPIQTAIDHAEAGDYIVLAPGRYDEPVIMWKPVHLQGWGPGAVTINPVKAPAEKLQAWRNKVRQLITSGAVDLLPGQPVNFDTVEPGSLNTEEGAGVLVLASQTRDPFGAGGVSNASIDGITITGADHGGAIAVNGYAHRLEIANTRIVSNQGFYGGGIRIGHPDLVNDTGGTDAYTDAQNDGIRIHHNAISQNGGLGGAGGGVSICTGAESYAVTENWICGNFNQGDGGGIGHFGRSNGGVIARNTILFNQSFAQGVSVSGGGVFVSGTAPLAANGLTEGTGNVTIADNLILGNQAGAGDGGGIRVAFVNGQEVVGKPKEEWHRVDVVDNMIVNNVAGLAGGGISLQDAAVVSIVNDTIAHNDSTATAGLAFTPGNATDSNRQPAGIVSRGHSPALIAALGPAEAPFSSPDLRNAIIWQNRSFIFHVDTTAPVVPTYRLVPDPSTPDFNDLGVIGAAGSLTPMSSLLTGGGDPNFVTAYFNGARNAVQQVELTTAIAVQPAFDEGGNYIDVRFGPLTLNIGASTGSYSNYHLGMGSAALARGDGAVLSAPYADWLMEDIDGQARIGAIDAGADQRSGTTSATTASAN